MMADDDVQYDEDGEEDVEEMKRRVQEMEEEAAKLQELEDSVAKQVRPLTCSEFLLLNNFRFQVVLSLF
jgi:3-phosphoglycerate kinase